MRVAVTGAGGFVGRHLVNRLLQEGCAVRALDSLDIAIPTGAQVLVGDLGDPSVRHRFLADGIDALVHLATVPGGAAEADPVASRRVNVDAMYDLMLEAGAAQPGLRIVFASSIAVFGDPLPALVDDQTPLNPKLVYGGHKAMMEQAVAMLSNRGVIDGISLRLPGILARPKGASGMKSAFMSDLFHAVRSGDRFVCPVSPLGTIWAESVSRCADNLLHAVRLNSSLLPAGRAVTLPALRVTLGDLAEEIAQQCGSAMDLVSYQPDPALEEAFATQPELATPVADSLGFEHDGDAARLVASALATLK